jgi:hypothetical protein
MLVAAWASKSFPPQRRFVCPFNQETNRFVHAPQIGTSGR